MMTGAFYLYSVTSWSQIKYTSSEYSCPILKYGDYCALFLVILYFKLNIIQSTWILIYKVEWNFTCSYFGKKWEIQYIPVNIS